MKYIATNIQWDTDGEDINLPTTLEVEIPNADTMDEQDIDEFISDDITNQTGFCHKGFSLK